MERYKINSQTEGSIMSICNSFYNNLERRSVKMFDYDELECPHCQHLGLLPNGGFDVQCPNCGYEGSVAEEPDEDK